MVDVLGCRCMFRCQEGLNQQERHGRITSEAIKCVGTTDPLHENLYRAYVRCNFVFNYKNDVSEKFFVPWNVNSIPRTRTKYRRNNLLLVKKLLFLHLLYSIGLQRMLLVVLFWSSITKDEIKGCYLLSYTKFQSMSPSPFLELLFYASFWVRWQVCGFAVYPKWRTLVIIQKNSSLLLQKLSRFFQVVEVKNFSKSFGGNCWPVCGNNSCISYIPDSANEIVHQIRGHVWGGIV